jgi:hypothetical protein
MKALNLFTKLIVLAIASSLFIACGPDDTEGTDPQLSIPDTYNFKNVSYSGQTARINMLGALTSYAKTAADGDALDAQKMKDMYSNTGNPFSDESLNTSGKDMQSKTFQDDVNTFLGYYDSLAIMSADANGAAASQGNPGIVTSNSGAKKYFVNGKGHEYAQLIDKGLMGALLYYQIASVYMTDSKSGPGPGVDNTLVVEGKGTEREHHWDEAFGYYGVPINFPANTDGISYIGKYGNDRDALVGNLNKDLMDGFILGRYAISNSDEQLYANAKALLYPKLEQVFAATAIHYLNDAKANASDEAIKFHALSEAYAFIMGLKYSPEKSFTSAEIEVYLAKIDDFYVIEENDINEVIDAIASKTDLTSIKGQL